MSQYRQNADTRDDRPTTGERVLGVLLACAIGISLAVVIAQALSA